ncbi:hypothetical protein ABW19_dt0203169 [Dactylella cylindrospora]|nr:hypothetical protein ABW19_dt0203169 [Dactylella cylindrospora]
MDFITKKTTHQIIPLFSGLWTSTPSKADQEEGRAENGQAKDKGPVVVVNGDEDHAANNDDVTQNEDRDRPLSTASAAAVPLPSSPSRSTPPEITKAPSNAKRRRKGRSFTPSKVFLMKATTTKRTDGKKYRMAASDVSVHFPKIHIDKGIQEDMQERLVEVSNASEVDLEGYLLSTNAISSFSLLSMATSARVANFSLPLHPNKVITVFFPTISNARPRPHSRSSSISTSSAASTSSPPRKQSQKKMTQKMLTMTSPGNKTRMFHFDGFNYRWLIEEDGSRALRRYSVPEAIGTSSSASAKPVDGELCARYSSIKRKNHSVLLVDPSDLGHYPLNRYEPFRYGGSFI